MPSNMAADGWKSTDNISLYRFIAGVGLPIKIIQGILLGFGFLSQPSDYKNSFLLVSKFWSEKKKVLI